MKSIVVMRSAHRNMMFPASLLLSAVLAVQAAFATESFRSMSVEPVREAGNVTGFSFSFGTAGGSTALYACWDAEDKGPSTNGWEHVDKIADISADQASLQIPISAFPKWGRLACRAIRFVLTPEGLFDHATKYLQTSDPGKQWIDTGYVLTDADECEASWTFTHITAQPNALVFGTVNYNPNGGAKDYFLSRYNGGGKVDGFIGAGGKSAELHKTVPDNYIREDTIVISRVSATERVIWTNSVGSATEPVEVARNDVQFDGSFTADTNCFLFGWPGVNVGGVTRCSPFSAVGNRITGRMYYFTVKRGGEYAVNCIPCVKNGKACFYDSVRNVFLYDGQNEAAFSTKSPMVDVNVVSAVTECDGAVMNEWTGDVDTDWFNNGNWSLGQVPGASDVAYIPVGSNVLLTNSTPILSELLLDGCLTMTNLSTKISSASVTVGEGGVITCTSGTTNGPTGRVWIECRDLEVNVGGEINVNGKGYASFGSQTMPSGDSMRGFGPGCSRIRMSASHGGYGGHFPTRYNHARIDLPYGSESEPVDAGSSGSSSKWGIGGAGGGIIRIDASGTVTVNGIVSANGGEGSAGGTYQGVGSGGSILINCSTFGGDGVISANGAPTSGVLTALNSGRSPGGGGRIAVHYDASRQKASMFGSMKITVSSTLSNEKSVKYNAQDYKFSQGDIGTLWFTDSTVLDALLGRGLEGQIRNIVSYSAPSLSMTWGRVRFSEDGANLSVAGNLSLSGSATRLEIGGGTATNRCFDVDLYSGNTANRIAVGGNLTISNGARLDLRSAATNAAESAGSLLDVGGNISVGDASSVYCWSDPVNGGAPRINCSNLTVAAGGLLSAVHRGFGSRYSSAGLGPGAGKGTSYYAAGGGHGGDGGLATGKYSSANGGLANDDEYLPLLPGSSGYCSYWGVGWAGGGVICVTAAERITLDGTIDVSAPLAVTETRIGGSAGGSVYLKCAEFTGASTGVINADGGPSYNSVTSGGGAGGRIAVWTGADWNGRRTSPRLTKSAVPIVSEAGTYLGTYTVNGGTSTYVGTDGFDRIGDNGTCWFFDFAEVSGTMLILK